MPAYSSSQVTQAIKQFLEFGEQTLGSAHQGYYGPGGWAYECLKWYASQMNQSPEAYLNQLERVTSERDDLKRKLEDISRAIRNI